MEVTNTSFFIPSLLDKSVCLEGKLLIHVYLPGGEPYGPRGKLNPNTPEYEVYKEERAEVCEKPLKEP